MEYDNQMGMGKSKYAIDSWIYAGGPGKVLNGIKYFVCL